MERVSDGAHPYLRRGLRPAARGSRSILPANHRRDAFPIVHSKCQGGQAAFFFASLALIEATSARGVAANRVLV